MVFSNGPLNFCIYKSLLARVLVLLLTAITLQSNSVGKEPQDNSSANVILSWPAVTQTTKPWTRWWWHGSAVDEENLTRLLQEYALVGLGGVEITCIYAVKGNEHRNREYLSSDWIQAVRHAIGEAQRLGLAVDLPAGSGWRMGGPSVKLEDANTKLELKKIPVAGGKMLAREYKKTKPQAIMAISQSGKQINLTKKISSNKLRWNAPPESSWIIYELNHTWSGDRVKRPAPGGSGLNINPFYKRSVESYLAVFSEKLDQLPGIRAQFHDSFEYEGNWQPDFLTEFSKRRGYRLEDHLPALAGDAAPEVVARVKCDYRETLSDLVLDALVIPWIDWSHKHNCLARNQGHGCPANWLDVYAACDIPETESFGRLQGGDADKLVLKFASSAANVAGRKLVSSESGTWLEEHFHVTLAALKQSIDRQFLAGVNHTFYHGTAYSPKDVQWPGWLFYASSQLNPQNPIWRDFPTLNDYVTRCQSFLQASRSDNDVLLYWPIHDLWQQEKGLRMDLQVHNAHDWFKKTPLGQAAKLLDENGYAFDYVSDRGLQSCKLAKSGYIETPGGDYSTIVIPIAENIPLVTLKKLNDLCHDGAKIIFWRNMPKTEPGMKGAKHSQEWSNAILQMEKNVESSRCFQSEDLLQTLENLNVRCENRIRQFGIDFLRKRWNDDSVYFLRNKNEQKLNVWISLSAEMESAVLLDPSSGHIGRATTRRGVSGQHEVRLQLSPGQSIFLLANKKPINLESWDYVEATGSFSKLPGPWQVKFISGGPVLPKSFRTSTPVSWTEAPDQEAQRFAGTVEYSTEFTVTNQSKRMILDLGKVRNSARVIVNGKEMATLISAPYIAVLDNLQLGENNLRIEVTGVAANRIRDLDRRKVAWKVFEDINFVNIKYRPFDASRWPVRPLGLIGPVTISPLENEDL